MSSTWNRLTATQKLLYGSMSFGGSDGNITPSDTLGSNKYVGLRADSAGDVKMRKINGQIQTWTVLAGEYMPVVVDTVYATGTTATVAGLNKLDETILDDYT